MRKWAFTALLVALDQVTKNLIWYCFRLGEAVQIWPGFFQIRYIRNEGAAWGILQGQRWPLILLSVVMLIVLNRNKSIANEFGWLGAASLVMLSGGIVGNLIDRVRFGYVIDFLDFSYGGRHFPAFNVADSAICIGVALYFVASFVKPGTISGGSLTSKSTD